MENPITKKSGSAPAFLSGGGEAAKRISSFDWSTTSLGPLNTWTQNLQTLIGLILNLKNPAFLIWGPEASCFYNDACTDSLATSRMAPPVPGDPLSKTWPALWKIMAPQIERVIGTGESILQADALIPLNEAATKEIYWTLSYSQVYTGDGQPKAVFVSCSDSTEKMASLYKLQETQKPIANVQIGGKPIAEDPGGDISDEQLRIAIDGGEMGTYNFYPQTGELRWSARAKALFGIPPDVEVTYDLYLQALHPDDREKATRAAENAMLPQNGGFYENEYRTIGISDGKIRWIRSKGRTYFDADQKPILFTGITQDITGQKALLANLELQSLVLNKMDEGVSVSDENGNILFTNPAENRMFGYEPCELIGKHVTIQNAYPTEENQDIVAGVIKKLKQQGFYTGEWHNRKKDGSAFFTHSFITSLASEGRTLFVCVQRDVTQEKEIAEKLAYRKALLEAQNEAIPDAVLIVDTKGNILSYNKHFGRLWNIPQDIIDRKDDTAALAFAMTQVSNPREFIERVNYCYAHPELKAYEEVLFKDGRTIERNGNAVIGEDGKSYGWIWYFRDITKQKQASEVLRASEDRYQNFIRQSTEGIWRFEVEAPIAVELPVDEQIELFFKYGYLAECNNAMAQMYGYDDASQMIGMRLQQLFPGDEDSYAYLSYFISSGYRVEAAESKEVDKAGEPVYFMNNLLGIVEDGKLIRAWGTQRDITAEKKAAKSLKDSEHRLQSLANAMPQVVWIADPDGLVTYYNDRVSAFEGVKKLPDGNWSWQGMVHDDDLLPTSQAWKTAVEHGSQYQKEHRIKMKDGSYRWHLSRALPQKDENGNVLKWYGTATDIHEQKLANFAIKESEQRFRTLAETLPQMIWIRNTKGEIEYGSSTWEKYSGIRDVREAWTAITHPDDWQPIMALWQKASAEGKSFRYEARLKNKEGEYRWHYAVGEPVLDDDGKVIKFIGSLTDIHVQKTFAEKLEKQVASRTKELATLNEVLASTNTDLAAAKNFLNTVLDSSVELVVSFDPDLRYTYANQRTLSFVGKPAEELIGKRLVDLYPGVVQSETYRLLLRALEGEPGHIERRASEVQKETVLETYVLPLKMDDKVTGVITLSRDITQITRLAESLKQSNAELGRSNEDLQQFAHVASHDLKEPVRKIMTFGNRLQQEFGTEMSELAKIYLSKMEASALRMYSMIDGVLLFSTLNALDQTKEDIDLNELIQSIENDLELLISEKQATIEPGELPVIEGSNILIYQLFYNLINNALKFSSVNRKPFIKITATTAQGDQNSIAPASGNYIKIVLQDNGIGFNDSESEKIFGTFTRLHSKDKFEGTGLGLSLCRKIVERHGGKIQAKGKEGVGATFEIILPMNQVNG